MSDDIVDENAGMPQVAALVMTLTAVSKGGYLLIRTAKAKSGAPEYRANVRTEDRELTGRGPTVESALYRAFIKLHAAIRTTLIEVPTARPHIPEEVPF